MLHLGPALLVLRVSHVVGEVLVYCRDKRDNCVSLIVPPCRESVRVSSLVSGSKKKISADLVIEQAKELYGFTLEEKSAENLEWMLNNGYLKKKRARRGTRGRRLKSEI